MAAVSRCFTADDFVQGFVAACDCRDMDWVRHCARWHMAQLMTELGAAGDVELWLYRATLPDGPHPSLLEYHTDQFCAAMRRTVDTYSLTLACVAGRLDAAQWLMEALPGVAVDNVAASAASAAPGMFAPHVAEWLRGLCPDVWELATHGTAIRIGQ